MDYQVLQKLPIRLGVGCLQMQGAPRVFLRPLDQVEAGFHLLHLHFVGLSGLEDLFGDLDGVGFFSEIDLVPGLGLVEDFVDLILLFVVGLLLDGVELFFFEGVDGDFELLQSFLKDLVGVDVLGLVRH